jgi:hypothetical protein
MPSEEKKKKLPTQNPIINHQREEKGLIQTEHKKEEMMTLERYWF